MNAKWLIAVFMIIAAVLVVVWYPSGGKPVNNKTTLDEPQEKQAVESMTKILTSPPPAQSQNGAFYPDHFPKQLPPDARIPADSLLQTIPAKKHENVENATLPQTMYNYPFPKQLPEGAVIPAK